jgi:SAM-dependent methyltransferase/DNA-directed RNA polymerase subunit RPC12/RpoP
MAPELQTEQPPVCDYEGSDYQERFWGHGEREYEDRVEAIAIQRLLPKSGKLLLEVGAGAGRNTPRYASYERIVVMDYSSTQVEQAQQRLGNSDRYVYVVADVYSLPFVDGLFDGATMIRVIHHMADAPRALQQIRNVMQPGGRFILEYANKRNLKAIARYALGRQPWNPFAKEPVEFIPLNFDFHPSAMRSWLREKKFAIERELAVSHFRMGWLKRNIPTGLLVALDSLFQPLGAVWQYTPSLFVRARAEGGSPAAKPGAFFKCPSCGAALNDAKGAYIECSGCGKKWGIKNGVYNFKTPL